MDKIVTLIGFLWHMIPTSSNAEDWKPWYAQTDKEDVELLSYEKDGRLVLTNRCARPLKQNWRGELLVNMDESWYVLKDGWKWKFVHQFEDGRVVLVGVAI